MARFKTILTNQGAAALTLAMYQGETIYPDYALMGKGIFDGPQATITELVEPVTVDVRIMDREFIEATEEQPSILQISVQTFNTGLTELTPIREIMLYANSSGGETMEVAIPFAYAWLDGDDTDNVLPPPLTPSAHDTVHLHELVLFVTNQEVASIEVSFAFNGFVTHRYLEEKLAEAGGLIADNAITTSKIVDGAVTIQKIADDALSGVEMSEAPHPDVGVRTHYSVQADVPVWPVVPPPPEPPEETEED